MTILSTLRPRPKGYFPGDRKFGDPYWLWYYLARRLFCERIDRTFDGRFKKKSVQEIKKSIKELLENIDRVPPEIIAKLDVNKLFDLAPIFCRKILRLTLERNHQGKQHLEDIERRSNAEMKDLEERKGKPREVITEPAASLVNALSGKEKDQSLFVEDWSAKEESEES